MQKVNWGIIGLGNIAQKFLEGFFEVKNSNLLAIASKSKSKLLKFKNQFKIKENYVFNNYEELFFNEGFMYRHDTLIKKIVELIKNNEIGNLISMESFFGVNMLTKKKLFFFEKKKKIDENSRQFNNQLGGGCILDLGCYPTSMSLLISSLVKNTNHQKFKIDNIVKEIGPTGVEIDAEAEIIFDSGFTSKVKASFKKDLGNSTIIYGEKGNIIISNTFMDIKTIQIVLKNKTYEIKKSMFENIFSQEINNISNSILNGSNKVAYPAMQLEETLQNMKILDYWKNDK